MSDETSRLVHQVCVELRKLSAESKTPTKVTVPREAREFVRSELSWIAEFLHKNFGLSVEEIRRVLREMLTVSV